MSEKRQRDHQVAVRLTEKEHATVQSIAQRRGCSQAEVLRHAAGDLWRTDAWGLTVVGLPRQQRHESGKGFKPVQASHWDYNCPWLTEGHRGYKLDWLPDPDAVAIGDVILLYDDPGDSGTFGFLYRVLSITDGWAKVESASPIRFQAHTDEEFDADHPTFPAHGASSPVPDDWGKPSGYEACPHMARMTSAGAGRIRVTCSACAEAAG